MISKTNSYYISPKGISYLVLKKKKCPLCKAKLVKTKEKKYTGIEKEYLMDNLNTRYVENYDIKIFYNCDFCNKSYSLEELATGKINNSNINERTPEEIKKSDEKMQNELVKYKKTRKFIFRLIYSVFFVVAFLSYFAEGSIIPFLMIFPIAIILMVSFEWSIRK